MVLDNELIILGGVNSKFVESLEWNEGAFEFEKMLPEEKARKLFCAARINQTHYFIAGGTTDKGQCSNCSMQIGPF